jgi:hypothetical protein
MSIKPFMPHQSLRAVSYPFPPPSEILNVGISGDQLALEAFVRLWLVEGCPKAFGDSPEVWEALRKWLGSQLGTCPREIVLVGSSRFGYSLSPFKWGRQFNATSDLDLAIVSKDLFSETLGTFQRWVEDYESAPLIPRNDTERIYWDENRKFGQKNLRRGFYDSSKLPTLDRYPFARKLGNAMWLLKAKLDLTSNVPKFRHASVRIYRDWASLVTRASLNFRDTALRISNGGSR